MVGRLFFKAAIAWLLFATDLLAATRPNVVVIMADDMGYADAGFMGSEEIETPHLDRLAASGVVCTRGYVNHPFCGPSRAAFLAGRFAQRFGFEDNPAYDPSNPFLGIDPGETLFPARLQQAGYQTACIGKWHLGAAEPFHPNRRGFDYFYGFLGGGHDYYSIDTRKPVHEAYFQPLTRNEQAAGFEGYLTTALSRDAADYIRANQTKPFFLFLSYNAPHAPLQAPPEAIAKYAHLVDWKRRVYAAMVDVMDQGIGLVIASLEETGLREDTLIFFLSDNGGPQPMSWSQGFWNGSSNGALRGGKVSLYEGGIRVPFVVSWPARLPAGTEYDSPVMAIDISRTAVEAADADASTSPAMEGVDLIPYLRGEKTEPPHSTLYWRGRNGRRWAVMNSDGDKYLKNQAGDRPEWFDLNNDVGEENNVAGRGTSLTSELRAQWDEWDKANVPGRIGNYLEYHEKRNRFYRDNATGRPPQAGDPSKEIKSP